jgi:agmatine deiminase
VAAAIADFEEVVMLVRPEHRQAAASLCGPQVRFLQMEYDDGWTRDTGPTFVIGRDGMLAGVYWQFNAWGVIHPYYQQDARVGERILDWLDMRRYAGPMVLEGGSIHSDGQGTLLTTEKCLLNPNRNPKLTREEIEAHLRAYLGVDAVIWLAEGLEDDETDGHVDNVACFVAPGRVLVLDTGDPEDGNYRALKENIRRLERARDAAGRRLEIIPIQQPARREGDGGVRLPLSYINFYPANGAVLMPSFGDPADEPAGRTLERVFPERRVIQINALDICHGGGGIHCITLQQPAAPFAFANRPISA